MTKQKLPLHPTHAMIEKFQCPGCVLGMDVTCGAFKLDERIAGTAAFHCKAHVAGTTAFPGGTFALGLPKGFNKVGALHHDCNTNIRLWRDGVVPLWNQLNVPVWAMKQDGYTFVRTYSPRINIGWVDVIENGPEVKTISADTEPLVMRLAPVDVGNFVDEID